MLGNKKIHPEAENQQINSQQAKDNKFNLSKDKEKQLKGNIDHICRPSTSLLSNALIAMISGGEKRTSALLSVVIKSGAES